MSTRQISHTDHTDGTIDRSGRTDRTIDWAREARLAVVLSLLAALTTIALAGHVPDRVLVTAVIVLASAVAWSRIEPLPRPERVPVRSR